jgi:hypothetical protein
MGAPLVERTGSSLSEREPGRAWTWRVSPLWCDEAMARRARSQDATEVFVRAAFRRGANPVLRKADFKRPGGGWTWTRDRPWLEQADRLERVSVSASFLNARATFGWAEVRLTLEARPRPAGSVFSVGRRVQSFAIDILGDAMDLAVAVDDWLRSDALPWFDAPLDLEALARHTEDEALRRVVRPSWQRDHLMALWRLAGRPEEAARVEVAWTPPRGPGDDLPL